MSLNLTQNQISEICSMYLSYQSSVEISNQFEVSNSSVLNILKKNNISIRKKGGKKSFSVNEDYFSQIDTEDKAYFLGLMFADGCIYQRKDQTKSFRLQISLQERDFDILQKFKECLKFKGGLRFLNLNNSNTNHSNVYSLSVTSNKICQDLIKLGCVQRKSLILKFPTYEQVPPRLIHHFIRGYFDGDGCIYKRNLSNDRLAEFTVKILGTIDICENIQNIFVESLNFNKTKLLSQGKCCDYRIAGNHQIRKLYHFLYSNANFFLERKRNKFLDLISQKIGK